MEFHTAITRLPSFAICLATIAGFFVLSFGVYGAALHNNFVAWDDTTLIYSQPVIKNISWANTKMAFTMYDPELYIPLTFLSYQLDYAVGGLNPTVYHVHNLILHTLSALLVAWLTYLLSRRTWIGIVCGALFAIHPLNTEAVLWASARKDTLSTLFFLASTIGYMYYRDSRSAATYIGSVFLFLLGLLAKVMVLTLPIVLLMIDYKEHQKITRKNLIDKLPYLALSTTLGVVALFGKEQALVTSTTLQKILMAFKSSAFYLQKIFLPTDLTIVYPYLKPITFSSDFLVPMALLIILGIVIAGIIRYLTKNNERDLALDIAFGFLFFFVTLAATFINFAKGEDFYFASDRYTYIPAIGIFYLVACVAWRLVHQRKRPMLYGATAVVILGLGILSGTQARVWRDTDSLLTHALKLYPEAYAAHINLAIVYREAGKYSEALKELEAAKEIKNSANTHSNFAAVYKKMGDATRAQREYEAAVAIDPLDAKPHFGLGVLYAEQNKLDFAEQEYRKSLALEPTYTAVYNNLGSLYEAQGKLAQAEQIYLEALSHNDHFAGLYYNLGIVYEQQRRFADAQAMYQKSLDLDPLSDDSWTRLGAVYVQIGKNADALNALKKAIDINRENAEARGLLQQMVEAGIVGVQ